MSNVFALTPRPAPTFNPAKLPAKVADVALGKTYRAKLTADNVGDLPLAPRGVYVVKDSARPGLELRVTRKSKTFYCRTRMGGREDGNNRAKPVRLGTAEELEGFAKVWTMYASVHGAIRVEGRDFNAEHAAARAEFKRTTETPATYWERYKERTAAHGRGKLRAATIRNYAYALPALLGTYWAKPMDALTADVVSDLFVAARDTVGLITARTGLRTLRAMQNYFDLPNTTAKAFKKNADARTKGAPRLSRLNIENAPTMAAWLVDYAAKQKAGSSKHTHAHILLVALLTGIRNRAIRNMHWEWLDLEHANIVVPAEYMKNGIAADLPLSAKVVEILRTRREIVGPDCAFVFPAVKDKRKVIAHKDGKFDADLPWHVTSHDGRKAMGEILANAEGVPYVALKALLTHSTVGDVTAHNYAPATRKAMRKAINLLATELLPG